jgi:hypothetical protein
VFFLAPQKTPQNDRRSPASGVLDGQFSLFFWVLSSVAHVLCCSAAPHKWGFPLRFFGVLGGRELLKKIGSMHFLLIDEVHKTAFSSTDSEGAVKCFFLVCFFPHNLQELLKKSPVIKCFTNITKNDKLILLLRKSWTLFCNSFCNNLFTKKYRKKNRVYNMTN